MTYCIISVQRGELIVGDNSYNIFEAAFSTSDYLGAIAFQFSPASLMFRSIHLVFSLPRSLFLTIEASIVV